MQGVEEEAAPSTPERCVASEIAGDLQPKSGTITFYGAGSVKRFSLAELDELARRVASWLASQGLRRGDRIGIVAANSLEWVLLDLAAIKLGVVTAGFEFGAVRPSEELLERYELKLLFTSGGVAGGRILDIGAVATSFAHEPLAPSQVSYGHADCTTIKFTSGSTGTPKGLAATVGSIDSSLAAVQQLFEHRPGDSLLVFLPLSLLQQRYWVYSALVHGHDVVVATHDMVLYACKQERPTVVMGVPAFFDGLMRQIEQRAVRACGGNPANLDVARRESALGALGDRIRYLWTGSAPARVRMLEYFTRCGFPIFEGYGMNETCIVTKNTPSANRVGSAGRVLPRKRIRIEEGVLIVSSDFPVNTRYLYGSPEAQAIFRPNGDVVTGDLARIDADGYLYILGRADEVVSLGNGRNVHVARIEERIKEAAGISQCVVVGAGEKMLRAVVSPGDSALDRVALEKCVEAVNKALEVHERIGEVVVAAEPFSVENGLLSSQGKPKRATIGERYGRSVS